MVSTSSIVVIVHSALNLGDVTGEGFLRKDAARSGI
jgi:hypothetical protein